MKCLKRTKDADVFLHLGDSQFQYDDTELVYIIE